MAAKKSRGKSFAQVFTYILLLLAVVGVIGFFAFMTNGFTTDFKTFYVEFGENRFMTDTKNVVLPPGNTLRFDCKYPLGFADKTPKGFTVKVVPNITEETDFDFTVDGQVYAYGGETDLTAAFDITCGDDYFTINVPKGCTMQQILQALYADKTVIAPEIDLGRADYFALIVTNYDGKASVRISFRLHISVTGVEIDKEEIVI